MPRTLRLPAWPLVLASAAFLAALVACARAARAACGGHLGYVLDDAYIHMAMAKHLATHGVFGVTPYAFSSSTSSPVWTLLLALAYLTTGVREVTPLVLATASGMLLLAAAERVMARAEVPAAARALALLALVSLTPMAPLALTGQEHLLHAALVVALIDGLARAVHAETPLGAPLLALAALAAAVRYETLLLVAAAAAALLVRRRVAAALGLGAAAAAPVIAFGLVAIAHGQRLLPYSILMKAPALEQGASRPLALLPVVQALQGLVEAPHLLVLVLAAGALALAAPPASSRTAAGLLFVLTALLHVGYARTGWFYRYEAYLVAAGLVAVATGASAALRGPQGALRGTLLTALAFVVAGPCLARAVSAHRETPRAARNVYEQQYQMGLFLSAYSGQVVGANDVGAIDYLADLRTVDLAGLASADVAEARLAGRFDRDSLERLAREAGMRIAVLYPGWLAPTGGVPASWVVVGRWRVGDNVVLGSDTVVFYAVAPDEAPRLAASLRAFAPRLPPGVEQGGPYLTRAD